jgi:DsbC/DsbD-like thiol-disulfide interchange protein/cytochrome c biogenesis protein CcdA
MLIASRLWISSHRIIDLNMHFFITLFASLTFFFTSSIASSDPSNEALNVPAVLQAETLEPAPGQSISVAFLMRPKPSWHGYWVNGGDAGLGMQLKWELPQGVRVGELRYPVPKSLMIRGLMNYVYDKPYALLADLQIERSIPVGSKLRLKVKADWLSCSDTICVPEHDTFSLDLVVGQGAISASNRRLFDSYLADLPASLDRSASFSISGKFIEIAIPLSAQASVSSPYFFPSTKNVIDYTVAQSARRLGDQLVIKAGYSGKPIRSFSGVLRYGYPGNQIAHGLTISAVAGTIPKGGNEVATFGHGVSNLSSPSEIGFFSILALSILGGIVLNLMPCVFPILGLKAFSLAKLGGDELSAKRDALAYACGAVLSVVALGAIMLALRAGGQQVGWAFQLQEPRIVLALLLLMAAVTLNLAGVFELGSINIGNSLTKKHGLIGSFWTGVLAAIIATPCTGPFMAVALGAALVLPIVSALSVFAGLGLGLALPYLAIGFIPKLRGLLPKPGAWLGRFRRLMAIPMGLTTVALFWLLWRLSGEHGIILAIVSVIAGASIFLFIGHFQRSGDYVPILLRILLLVVTLSSISALPSQAVISAIGSRLLASEPYSERLLDRYRTQGKDVFVYFTADWCVTCKINEANAIDRKAVASAFVSADVKVLVGDFTRRDPTLSRVLADYGRAGVPLYIFYKKGQNPIIMPQILMSDMIISNITPT